VAKEYADLVVKPPLEQLGDILSDTVGYWRLKNRINLLLKTKKFLEAKGISPEKSMPSVFVPLLEEAGNTDDPDISEMFARLLATQLNPTTQKSVHPSFAKVLGELSPLDAHLLRLIDEKERIELQLQVTRPGTWLNWKLPTVIDEAKKKLGTPEPEDIALSIHNLTRLGVLEDVAGYRTLSDTATTLRQEGLRITDFGQRFLSACSSDYWRKWEYRPDTLDQNDVSPEIQHQHVLRAVREKTFAMLPPRKRTLHELESRLPSKPAGGIPAAVDWLRDMNVVDYDTDGDFVYNIHAPDVPSASDGSI
jgi:hypothetical protein